MPLAVPTVFQIFKDSCLVVRRADTVSIDYLEIMDRVLIPRRTIVREGDKYYKVYLPREYNEILGRVYDEGRSIDVVVFLSREIMGVTKILMPSRRLSRERDRYKLYLSNRYRGVWEQLVGEKIDLLIIVKQQDRAKQ